MSDLQNLTPANTYKALLQIGDYTNGISGDTGANALQVSDGAGNNTSLALSTDRVGIGNTSPSAELDVSGDVVADEYAFGQTGSSSSAVAIHAPATNELAIRTNTAERVRIDSSGNVGIGTNSPSYELEVVDSSGDAFISVVSPNVDEAGIVFGDADLAARGGVIYDNSDNSLAFRTSTNTEKMRIDSSGNVGIGTTSPTKPLHILSTVADQIVLEADSTTIGPNMIFKNTDGNLARIRTDDLENLYFENGTVNTTRMTIDPSGNVGIGTTSPSAPLEVTSTTGGVIMPRMNTSQRTAISASDGEMVYDTDLNKFYGYANGAWVALH